MKVQKMGLGAADDSGRRRPVVIAGSEYVIDVDTVVVGVGTDPNPLIPQAIQGLEVTKWGTIVVNEETMQTAVPEIFAGGDIVRGGATVILAMGDGKKAAASMHDYLLDKIPRDLTLRRPARIHLLLRPRLVTGPYSTLTRVNPLAGAVCPARRRSLAAKMSGMSSASIFPRPTSISVPTMLRTM